MTISANPVTINSSAKNGTLGTQGTLNDNQIKFDTDISTNNSNLVASPTFVGRLVILRRGDGDEETNFMSSVAGDNVTVDCVNNWVSNPVSGDTYDICYICVDADTIGNNFKVLSKRVSDWVVATDFMVGNGTDFAYFALLEGHSIETDDGVTVSALKVESPARMDVGYLSSGKAVSSGYIISTANTAGDIALQVESGATIKFYDCLLSCVQTNKVQLLGECTWQSGKVFAGTYNMDLTGNIFVDVTIEGRKTSNEYILADASFDNTGLVLISTYGFQSPDTTTETVTILNVTFIGNYRSIYVTDNKTWEVINPSWNPSQTNQRNHTSGVDGDLQWDYTTTAGVVRELFELYFKTVNAAGSALSEVQTYVHEATENDDLPTRNRIDTDVDGIGASEVLTRLFSRAGTDTITTTVYGGHSVYVIKYTYSPYTAPVTFDERKDFPLTLVVDGEITETDQATAITAGSGIVWTEETNPGSIIKFTGGSGTLSVGNTVTGGTSGADGIVVEFDDGDSTAGTIFLKTRDGVSFSGTEQLSNGSGWTADLTSGSEQRFKFWIDCNSLGMAIVHDYLLARMAEDTPQNYAYDMIIWVSGLNTKVLFKVGTSFYSERNSTAGQGVYFADRGSGSINYFKDDSGVSYVPPVTRNYTLTGLDIGSRVQILKESDRSKLGGTTSSGASYTYQYVYTADTDIIIVIMNSGKEYKGFEDTLLNSDKSVPVQLTIDRNYST